MRFYPKDFDTLNADVLNLYDDVFLRMESVTENPLFRHRSENMKCWPFRWAYIT